MLRLPETEAQCKSCSDLYVSHGSGCHSNTDKNKRELGTGSGGWLSG